MKSLILSAALALFSSAALAAPLLPDSVLNPVGTTAADPVHGGIQTVINDNLINFRMDPTPSTPFTDVGGQIQNRVTERSSDGGLNFAPRIRNTFNIDGGTFAIVAMQLTGFGMFDLNAEFRTDGLGDKGPTSYSRSANGDIITMRFTNPATATTPTEGGLLIDAIAPGLQEESLFPSFVSNANHFDFSGTATIFGYLIDSGEYAASGRAFQEGDLITVTVDGLAVPTTAPVPLPASVLLLGAGVAGLGLLKRKSAS